jgi:SAM-dependent methyltransferase
MKFINTRCPFCHSLVDYTVIYSRNFKEFDFNANVFSARRIPDRSHYQIVKCNKDSLVRSNPVLEDQDIYELYRKSRFTYEEETEHLATTYLTVLRPILRKLPKDAKILEIGCGNGFLLKSLYDMGYKDVCGVEPSLDALKKSDKTIRDKIVSDVLTPGTFKSGEFSLICFFQLLDHIPDPDDFLNICYKILSPGGFILAFNHDVESLQARLLKEKSPIIDIEHTYFFAKETIKKIFEKHNFLPLKVYSPANAISLRHVIWLLPVPKQLKKNLMGSRSEVVRLILKQKIKVKLGNLCLVAKKGFNDH